MLALTAMKVDNIREAVYTPGSEVLHPGRLFLSMFRDLATRGNWPGGFSCEILVRVIDKVCSVMSGPFSPPLAATIPFVFLRSQGLFTTGATAIPYPAYVMISMLFWQVFVDAVQSPLKSVIAAKPMLSKIQFPPEGILLAGLGDVLFSFVIRLILLAGVLLWYRLMPPPTVVFVPFAVAALVILWIHDRTTCDTTRNIIYGRHAKPGNYYYVLDVSNTRGLSGPRSRSGWAAVALESG